MKVWMKVAATGAVAVLALVFAWRSGAAASSDATCAPTSGFVVQFCVNVPSGSVAVRRDTTVPLNSVNTARTDLRVEAGIPATEIVRVPQALDEAALRVDASSAVRSASDPASSSSRLRRASPGAPRTGVGNGYDLGFTVTADDRGMFRGSFGSTAAAGAYMIAATSGALYASAEIANTR